MHAARLAALVLVALVGLPATAHAQERQMARDDFRAGVTSLESGDFVAAEAAFHRSLASLPTAAAQCNLALTYDRWGDHGAEALAAYEECADRDASGQYRDHALERADELRAERDAVAADGGDAQTPSGPSPIPLVQGSSAPTMVPSHTTSSAGMVYQQAPPPQPSRTFLWLGVVAAVAAGGALLAGALLAASAGSDADELEAAGYPMAGDRYLIPADDPGAQTLSSAQTKSAAAIGLYIGAAIAGALAITFFTLQTQTGSAVDASVALAPIEGGALVSARLSLD